MVYEAFVYCWTDKANNMLYVGYHKGSIDDNYICSSKTMLEEYKKRPNDFSRQIIASGSVNDMIKLESTILHTVNAKKDKLFYNRHNGDGMFYNKGHSEETKAKFKDRKYSEETRKKMSIAKIGKKQSEKTIAKRVSKNKGQKRTIEQLKTMSKAQKNKVYSEIGLENIKKSNNRKKGSEIAKKTASIAGKISAEKYKQDPIRQKMKSERMKLWWAERKNRDKCNGL